MSGSVRDTLVIPQTFLGRDGQEHHKWDFQCSCGYHTGKGALMYSEHYDGPTIPEMTYTLTTLSCECGAEWPATSWELGSGKIVRELPKGLTDKTNR